MFKNLFLVISFFVISSSLSAQAADDLFCGPEINPVDFPALENYLRAQRTESVADKLPEFKISGDVRVDYIDRRERQGSFYLRGGNAHDRNNIAIPSDLFALKTNLRADYVNDRCWLVAQVEFDNNAGIDGPGDFGCTDCPVCPQLMFGSGFCDYLCLKRAYAGFLLWKCDDEKLTAEIGRRSLYYVFDSRIQYKARVDGIFARYSNTYAKYEDDRTSNFFLQGAYFLIDKHCNHFGYAFEAGNYNLCDTGFDLFLSFINWRKHGLNECGVRDPLGWRFTNVQFNLDYNFKDKVWGRKLNLYSAFEINLAARHESFNVFVTVPATAKNFDDVIITPETEINPNKENRAWYMGFIWGEVKKKGDFSFDFNYQYVEAEAVPDCDLRGIGRGNANKESFSRNRRGNSNYKGIHAELLYAFTDRLQIDIAFDSSHSVDKNVGELVVFFEKKNIIKVFKNHIYNRFEVELIHAF